MDSAILLHLLYMGLNESDLFIIKVIFSIELLVDVSYGLRPVNVGIGCEILEWNIFPFSGVMC